jgi:homoserine kinase
VTTGPYDARVAAFVSTPVQVRVPATSANLGPGFDALGLALDLHDEVTARLTGAGIRVTVTGQGAGELPTDASHLVIQVMLATFDRLGVPHPTGLDLHCHNRIPQARGLGSSSAAIVAGILAARALVVGGDTALPPDAVLALANELEGHPDNVAPCLLGGFTIAWLEPAPPDSLAPSAPGARSTPQVSPAPAASPAPLASAARIAPAAPMVSPAPMVSRNPLAPAATADGSAELSGSGLHAGAADRHGSEIARAVRLEPAAGVHPVVFVPQERGLTAQARAALPAVVPHADAARNAGRAALLVHALTREPGLLFVATEDRLHQGYRAPGMPATAALVDRLRSAGIPAVVSGAGPTVLAFGAADEMPVTPGWVCSTPTIDSAGAQVRVDWQHAG